MDNDGVARGWNYSLRKKKDVANLNYNRVSSYSKTAGVYTIGSPPYPKVDFKSLFRAPQTEP